MRDQSGVLHGCLPRVDTWSSCPMAGVCPMQRLCALKMLRRHGRPPCHVVRQAPQMALAPSIGPPQCATKKVSVTTEIWGAWGRLPWAARARPALAAGRSRSPSGAVWFPLRRASLLPEPMGRGEGHGCPGRGRGWQGGGTQARSWPYRTDGVIIPIFCISLRDKILCAVIDLCCRSR
jgi:hypothetical protein